MFFDKIKWRTTSYSLSKISFFKNVRLRFCDQLILLYKGKIVANASSENVFHSSAFKAAFQLNIQTEGIKKGFDLVIGFDS